MGVAVKPFGDFANIQKELTTAFAITNNLYKS
jgi:hypothetical protein